MRLQVACSLPIFEKNLRSVFDCGGEPMFSMVARQMGQWHNFPRRNFRFATKKLCKPVTSKRQSQFSHRFWPIKGSPTPRAFFDQWPYKASREKIQQRYARVVTKVRIAHDMARIMCKAEEKMPQMRAIPPAHWEMQGADTKPPVKCCPQTRYPFRQELPLAGI